jgi:septum formation protein
MVEVILASGSSIRQLLLRDAGIEFEVIKPLCDEDALKEQISHLPIAAQALYLAEQKALSVSEIHPNAYVIGSDQICECDGRIINKSTDAASATRSLEFLSGKTHTQNNGTCIFYGGKPVMQHKAAAKLTMRALTPEDIASYIQLDDPIGSAGSYKFESHGKNLFAQVEGERETILGFGLSAVVGFLKKTNV